MTAHVFVADLDELELAEDDRHHLTRVLRLRPGEAVTASDGHGAWRTCEWRGGDDPLAAVGAIERSLRPDPVITIAFAITKGERPEWAVQKLTEAGVDRVVPMTTARSVVRWDGDRAGRHVERLRRVAREAAMQSHRVWLPEVTEPMSFADVVASAGGAAARAEQGGLPPSLRWPTILVGPEGGWTPDEQATVTTGVGLGPNVYRAETAAVAAGLLLAALRHGVVGEPPPPEGKALRL